MILPTYQLAKVGLGNWPLSEVGFTSSKHLKDYAAHECLSGILALSEKQCS